MKPKGSERRVHRFTNPAEALSCWLDASRRRTQLTSLALADDLGILVAGSGPARECDELAAWAPLVLGNKEPATPAELSLTGVKLPGFDAYVCAPGEAERHHEFLSDVALGCARILGRPIGATPPAF